MACTFCFGMNRNGKAPNSEQSSLKHEDLKADLFETPRCVTALDPRVVDAGPKLGGSGVILLMIQILHDLVYRNPGNYCSMVHIESCGISIINRPLASAGVAQ